MHLLRGARASMTSIKSAPLNMSFNVLSRKLGALLVLLNRVRNNPAAPAFRRRSQNTTTHQLTEQQLTEAPRIFNSSVPCTQAQLKSDPVEDQVRKVRCNKTFHKLLGNSVFTHSRSEKIIL